MKGIERKGTVTRFLLPPKEKIKITGCFVPCLGVEEPILVSDKAVQTIFPKLCPLFKQ